jgi:hypothetical protein
MRTPAVWVAWRLIAFGGRAVAIDFTYRSFRFRAVGTTIAVDLAVVARVSLAAVAMPVLCRRVVASLAERHADRL